MAIPQSAALCEKHFFAKISWPSKNAFRGSGNSPAKAGQSLRCMAFQNEAVRLKALKMNNDQQILLYQSCNLCNFFQSVGTHGRLLELQDECFLAYSVPYTYTDLQGCQEIGADGIMGSSDHSRQTENYI